MYHVEDILVSPCDKHLLKEYTWYLNWNNYPTATKKIDGKTYHYRLNRLIMNPQKGKLVDHINGNKLDNRRSNLRIVTHLQNAQNKQLRHKNSTSGFRGVTYDKRRGKFRAQWVLNSKYHHVGYFDSVEKAAAAVDAYRRSHYNG